MPPLSLACASIEDPNPVTERYIVAHAAEVAGIKQRNPGAQRGMDGGDPLGTVSWSVKAGHAHAAETDGGYGRSGTPELAFQYDCRS